MPKNIVIKKTANTQTKTDTLIVRGLKYEKVSDYLKDMVKNSSNT